MTVGFTPPGDRQHGTPITRVQCSTSPSGSGVSRWLVATGLAALLLCPSGASAGEKNEVPRSPKSIQQPKRADETVCENKKLEAAANYYQCLIGVYRRANIRDNEPSEDSIARCDDHFRQVVEQAEAGGACHTPGNPSVLGDRIKAYAQATALGVTAELGGCTALNITTEFATCALGPGSRAVDLTAVIDAINNVGGGVDNNTPFYIEAWGGDGGPGNTNNGSRGGFGGYAQTTTTTGAVAATYGTAELYYFLGDNGSGAANAGGDGGTATMVTTNDLATAQAAIADTLLIAGGAGGGGAGRGKLCACGCNSGQGQTDGYVLGALGGDGGAAIAPKDVESLAAGAKGGERENINLSGSGGVGNAAGTGGAVNGADHVLSHAATVGGNGIAPIAGRGGNHTDPQTGFANSTTVITNTNGSGQGGDGQEDAGGGGGGGGGAGNVDPNNSNDNTDCITGGGGGGASLAVASTATCSAAPTSKPANPNGSQGFAQIVFDLGGCQ
jgi:hypothetical protein